MGVSMKWIRIDGCFGSGVVLVRCWESRAHTHLRVVFQSHVIAPRANAYTDQAIV